MLFQLVLFLILFVGGEGLAGDMAQNCDLLGKNIRTIKNSDQKGCRTECLSEPECQGAVFISSWNRCFLKESIKRQVKVTMSSGIKGGRSGNDLDFTGKDLIQLDKPSSEECAMACEKNTKCTGYTYIDGYRTCWIKSTKGKLIPKVFFCFKK